VKTLHTQTERRPHVLLVMASRRDGESAQLVRERFLETVDRTPDAYGLLIDRTTSGVVWSPQGHRVVQDISRRFTVVRQGNAAPLSAGWKVLAGMPADWIMQFHDDDTWDGVPAIPSTPDTAVALYAPRLVVSDGTNEWLAHQWTTQHALFGAIRGDVFAIIARYLANAPNPWGGEDLMILSFTGALGRIEQMSGYSYVWHRGNWTSQTSETSTHQYLAAQGWGHLSSLSTYLLLQSLDRLAIFGAAHEVPDPIWLSGVDDVLGTFWPVIDPRGHRILSQLPPRLRGAMIASRGTGSGSRRVVEFLRNVPGSVAEVHPADSFTAFATGQRLVRSPEDVFERLIPALTREAPVEAYPQIEYWAQCITKVWDRYSQVSRA